MKTRRFFAPTRAGFEGGASALALALVLALSGCASPYAPPIVVEPPPQALVRPPELAHAMAVAWQKHASYRAKVLELGESERSFSNGVYGLGTVILGLAAANTHSSAIRGAVLGTGAVYGAGELNTDRRRSDIHLAGMAALECAVAATKPLSLNASSEATLLADRQRIASLVTALTTAEGAALAQATLAPLMHPTQYAAAVQAIQTAVLAARVAREAASRADQLTRQRLEAPTVAAVALRNAIDGIDREVLVQLESTRPSLQSIPAQLAQLQANKLFSGLTGQSGAGGGAAPAPGATEGNNGPHSIMFTKDAAGLKSAADAQWQLARDMARTRGDLEAATSAVLAAVEAMTDAARSTAGQVADALAACQVAGVVQPLTVAEAIVRLPAGKALIEQVLVQGGNGLLRPGFTRKPVPGLTVSAPPGTTGMVEIQATEQTVAGTYPLLVEDTTMKSRVTITVVVEAAAATPPKPPTNTTQAALLDKAQKMIPVGTVIKLADGNATITKVLLQPNQAGIEVEYTTTSPTATPEVVEQAILALPDIANLGATVRIVASKAAAAPHAARFSRPEVLVGLPRATVQQLQARLCMAQADQDGLWGPATQRALALDRAQRDTRQAVPSGPLSEAERVQLLALTPAEVAARCAQRTTR